MGCYCDCYEGPEPEFFSKKTPRARKEHKCYECGELIEKGETYHRITGKWEGDLSSFTICLECEVLRSELELFLNAVVDSCTCIEYGLVSSYKGEATREGWSADWCLTAPPESPEGIIAKYRTLNGDGEEKCRWCDHQSVSGLVEGKGQCPFHWSMAVLSKRWAAKHFPDHPSLKKGYS